MKVSEQNFAIVQEIVFHYDFNCVFESLARLRHAYPVLSSVLNCYKPDLLMTILISDQKLLTAFGDVLKEEQPYIWGLVNQKLDNINQDVDLQ